MKLYSLTVIGTSWMSICFTVLIGTSRGIFVMCPNAILVLSQKNASQNGVPGPFSVALV
jgi:hypothetical protein